VSKDVVELGSFTATFCVADVSLQRRWITEVNQTVLS